MRDLNPKECFDSARKLGLKEYSSRVSMGQIGYIPSLEGLLKNTEIVSQVNLGIIEIPLKKIAGTYSHSRSLAFAANFMPIIESESEFKSKWISLCSAHLMDGIRDSIKVYEYLNWFYVIEGNKRVSVLKYFEAYSISADVIRLIPKRDDNDINNVIYYEFLRFNNRTKLQSIWFSNRGSFDELYSLLQKYNPNISEAEDKYKHFEIYVYNIFRRIYHQLGGGKLKITTGDAFIQFARIYGIQDVEDEEALKQSIKGLIIELENIQENNSIHIQTSPASGNTGGVISTITSFIMPPKKLRIGFIYARNTESSGWTYSHELGRWHIEGVFKNQITTSYIDNVPENEEAYYYIKKLADEGNDVIFTTSEVFMRATLRCALEYPNIKFFNCSESRPYKHLSNYFGRTYEPRFLTGIIAGAMTKSDIVGYAATSPTPEVISCINAFALGAKMVNPRASVKVAWTNEWNSPIKSTNVCTGLINAGADIICNKNIIVPREVTKKYGVYSMLCSIDPETLMPDKYLAAPIWKWGIFYEKIINNILNDTFKTVVDMFNSNTRLINFWWGMASGALDIYYSKKYVPVETQKLVDLLKRMIINNEYHPFTGPIFDNMGNKKIQPEELATSEEILSMDWYVDNVEVQDYTEPEEKNLSDGYHP